MISVLQRLLLISLARPLFLLSLARRRESLVGLVSPVTWPRSRKIRDWWECKVSQVEVNGVKGEEAHGG